MTPQELKEKTEIANMEARLFRVIFDCILQADEQRAISMANMAFETAEMQDRPIYAMAV